MVESQWLSARELEAWESFLAVSTILGRQVEQQLKDDAGLSHSQYEVLARLSSAPGGELRMTELAGIAKTSKSGLTYQVAQLEKAGLVRRASSPGDDRGVVAKLTVKGRKVLQVTAPAHAALVRELFVDGLSQKQFTGFADGIRVLRQRLLEAE